MVATTAAAPAKKTSTAKKSPAASTKKAAAKKETAAPSEEAHVETAVLANVSPETVAAVIGHKEDEKYEKVQIGQKMPDFLL